MIGYKYYFFLKIEALDRVQVVIVTDIFGRTSMVDRMADCLKKQLVEVVVLDPYGGIKNDFVDETVAYAEFISLCGHDPYAALVQQKIADLKGPLLLIGFSAGATAIWRCLDGAIARKIQHFVGFYPGQIRNHLCLIPLCPSTLIFPSEEKHFSVGEVMEALKRKEKVHCHQVSALHGFMNDLSPQYSKDVADEFYGLLGSVELSSHPDFFKNISTVKS